MTDYVPAKLAFDLFEPFEGADEKLSPIIFLHGVTGGKENWNDIPQIVANGTKRKAYALDARNHGDSERCNVFNFKVNIDDMFHFMDTINAPKATLVGHSMGGITAIGASLRNPERIEMVIIEDIFTRKLTQKNCDNVLEAVNMRALLIQSIPAHIHETDAVKYLLDIVFSQLPENVIPFTKTDDLYDMKISFLRTEDGGFDVKYDKEAINNALKDSENLMDEPNGQYFGPAHFFYGSRSSLLVENEKENIRKHFPKAEFIKFEKATHYLHMEFPKKFTENILNICSKLKFI